MQAILDGEQGDQILRKRIVSLAIMSSNVAVTTDCLNFMKSPIWMLLYRNNGQTDSDPKDNGAAR
jgi:hypothetical protein